MIGSHTDTTFSMRSQAAWAAPDHMVNPANNAAILQGFIELLRLRLSLGSELIARTNGRTAFRRRGTEDWRRSPSRRRRAVHVSKLIRDLGIDDAVAQAIDRANEHFGNYDHD